MNALDKVEPQIVLPVLEIIRTHLYEEVCGTGNDFSYHFLGNLLKKLDPSLKGKHHKWLLLRILQNPDLSPLKLFEDVQAYHDVLQEFSMTKKYLPVYLRDINQYGDLECLKAHLYAARMIGGRASRELLATMSLDSAMDDTRIQYEGQDMVIYKPRNIEQAILLGDGANWRFDDRDGGLYSSLRKNGAILVWFTSAGRFLSVIPHQAGDADYIIDEDGELTSFHEISSAHGHIEDNDENLITAVISAEAEAAFYLNWSVASKIKAVTANPLLLENYDVREDIKQIEENGTLGEAYWAKAVLDSYMNTVESLTFKDSIL
jgi:hypothetical protein